MGMVYPNEGEHWGSLADGSYGEALAMKDTKFYKDNLFGLKDADEAGKIHFETTPGDHLQFTDAELYGWLDKYFLGKSESIVVGAAIIMRRFAELVCTCDSMQEILAHSGF